MKRRAFVGGMCAGLMELALHRRVSAGASAPINAHGRARLVTSGGGPLNASNLTTGTTYLFHYPFAGTPCFLLRLPDAAPSANLTDAEGAAYHWNGGVGPDHCIVAFAAICSHQLTRVSKRTSFINYYYDKPSEVAGRAGVIACCAHHSVFDPAAGSKVLSGPAPQPLTAIVLEYDDGTDGLYAVGTQGPEYYDNYFSAYRRELIEEFGRGVARNLVRGSAPVYRLEDYTGAQIRC
jgi:arsenite oxidase small subunit